MNMNQDQINEVTKQWLGLWKNPETRFKMDAVLAALSREDQMLMIRIGQRMQLNLPIKSIEPMTGSSADKRDNL